MPHKDPIKRKEYVRKYVRENQDKIKERYRRTRPDLKSAYGLSADEYHRMIQEQGGQCLICLRPSADLCVDHDHATGQIRGLLCKRCNAGLGQFYDDVTALRRAIEYIEKARQDGQLS